jgi:hypothetical protein
MMSSKRNWRRCPVVVLQIEHPVGDFELWKGTFDADPARRREGGVRGYRILRPIDDPQRVQIELEFDDRTAAAAFGERLAALWATPSAAGLGIGRPDVRLTEVADSHTY